jgi:hypothetical protein
MRRCSGFLIGLAAAILLLSHAQAQTMNPDTDRRMQDDRQFELPSDKQRPRFCLDACIHDAFCRAWTFSTESGSGALCSLGNQRVEPRSSPCCTSGNVQ